VERVFGQVAAGDYVEGVSISVVEGAPQCGQVDLLGEIGSGRAHRKAA